MPRVTIIPRQQPTSTSSSSSTTSTNTSSPSPSASSSPTSSSPSSTSTVTGSPSSSTTSTSTVNTSAFFPDPSQRVQPSKDSSELPKRVLEWIFLSLAIILVFGLIVRRLNQLHIQQRPLSEFFSCFRRRSRRHHHRACCHHNPNRSNNRLFCHSRQSSQSTSTSSSSSSRVTGHVNVVRGRYDLRVPPSAYVGVGVGVGALRTTTRRYAPVALDLANVPLSAELDALGRGTGDAGGGAGARLGLGILGGRAATRGVTRAMNVDEGGRRLDSGRGFDGEGFEGEDGDGGLGGGRGEKPEELPAYDKYGGPPGYHEHAVGGGRGMPVIMTVMSDGVEVGDYEAWIRQQQQQQQQEMQDGEEGTVQGRTVQDGVGSGRGGEEREEQEGIVMFTGVGAGGGLGGNWNWRREGSGRRVDSDGGSGEGVGVIGVREGDRAEREAEDRGGAEEDRTGAEEQGTTVSREEREGREDRE